MTSGMLNRHGEMVLRAWACTHADHACRNTWGASARCTAITERSWWIWSCVPGTCMQCMHALRCRTLHCSVSCQEVQPAAGHAASYARSSKLRGVLELLDAIMFTFPVGVYHRLKDVQRHEGVMR